MLCQHCEQNEATTHIRRMVNGAAEEFHLCAACAKEAGIGAQLAMPEFGFHLSDLFSGFLGSSLRGGQSLPSPVRCELCGSSLDEIIRSSRVGCARCYETFDRQLQPTLQRIHGGALRHTGKTPETDPAETARRQRQTEIDHLRGKIAEAVQAEDYEQAAKLRDEIRKLEEGGEGNA